MKPRTNVGEEDSLLIICHYLFSIEKGKAAPKIICANMAHLSEAIRFSTRWRIVFFLSCVVARAFQIFEANWKSERWWTAVGKIISSCFQESATSEKTTCSVNKNLFFLRFISSGCILCCLDQMQIDHSPPQALPVWSSYFLFC